ncbi:Septin-domain-containing protein, partial [Backusella circina FSU 941]
ELEEDGVTLKLRLIDTPGFGDQIDRSKDLESILQYIDDQYQDYYDADSDVSSRKDIQDNRVHLCFYFIPPTIRGLKELDIVTMKALSSRVNLIPLVSKADTLSLDEKKTLKEIILEDIEKFDIKVFPNAYDDHEIIPEIENAIPFAIVGSEDQYKVNGKTIRAREYPWGYVDVEDPKHSDFIHVRELIMGQCLEELVSLTHTEHYHNMRMGKLKSKLPKDRPDSFMLCDEKYDETMEDMQTQLVNDMNKKEENLRQQFVQQVKTAEGTLKEKEYQLEKKRDQLNAELETKQKAIEETERAIQELRQRFENVNLSQRS